MKLKSLIIFLCASTLILSSGCLRKELADANLSGEIMTDTKGRKWLITHNIGDTFFFTQ